MIFSSYWVHILYWNTLYLFFPEDIDCKFQIKDFLYKKQTCLDNLFSEISSNIEKNLEKFINVKKNNLIKEKKNKFYVNVSY